MQSVSHLLSKLRRRPRHLSPARTSAKTCHECDRPLAFAEILAASAYLDFGGLPLEFWPGYRDAAKAADDDRQ
jgi:hypothetical protein